MGERVLAWCELLGAAVSCEDLWVEGVQPEDGSGSDSPPSSPAFEMIRALREELREAKQEVKRGQGLLLRDSVTIQNLYGERAKLQARVDLLTRPSTVARKAEFIGEAK